MFLAILDTPNFSFHVLGTSADDAMESLRKGWERHAEETGATYPWQFLAEDVNIYPIELGQVTRDGEPI